MSSRDNPHLITLLRRLHLRVRRRLHDDIRAAGFDDLAPAHLYVFQSPGPDGLRPGELASRTNMSKQAMNHLLAALERGGYLARVPAPDDGRGRVLKLTARGHEVTRLMVEGSLKIEREWADRVGSERLEQLHQALSGIDAAAGDVTGAS